MKIHGYDKLTLLDYPGKVASTIFCGHCNFRCPFCHNASLVLHADEMPLISEEEIFEHLTGRKGVIEGVAITGGEPTLYRDLPDFIVRLKEKTGVLVKLDTNGTNPDMLAELMERGLIDRVAMDIKSSPAGYAAASGLDEIDMDAVFKSVDLIMKGIVEYEFRTTVVDELHGDREMKAVGKWLTGASAYYLQCYKDSGELINPEGLHAPSAEKLEHFRQILLPFIPNTYIRGVSP